jgi:transcriptional regulator with XRE-family HTH domain
MGLSQAELAARVGVSQQAIQQLEAGQVESPRYIKMLSKVLLDDALWSEARYDEVSEITDSSKNQLSSAERHLNKIELYHASRDNTPRILKWISLPEYGGSKSEVPIYTAAHPEGGEFLFSFDESGRAARPGPLVGVKSGFGLYVVSNYMEPAYRSGDVIFFHPTLPIHVGNDALLIFHTEGDVHRAVFAHIVAITSDEVTWCDLTEGERITEKRELLYGIFVAVARYIRA